MREVKRQRNATIKVCDNSVSFHKYHFGNCSLTEVRSPVYSNWLSLSKQAFINSCSQISLDELKPTFPIYIFFKVIYRVVFSYNYLKRKTRSHNFSCTNFYSNMFLPQRDIILMC
jgi:hypothetical protein